MKNTHCNKLITNRNGQGANATRYCGLKVHWVDPCSGRGWCRRHEPDDDRKAIAARNAEITRQQISVAEK